MPRTIEPRTERWGARPRGAGRRFAGRVAVDPRPEPCERPLEDFDGVDLLPAGRGRELVAEELAELRVRAGEDARVAMPAL